MLSSSSPGADGIEILGKFLDLLRMSSDVHICRLYLELILVRKTWILPGSVENDLRYKCRHYLELRLVTIPGSV